MGTAFVPGVSGSSCLHVPPMRSPGVEDDAAVALGLAVAAVQPLVLVLFGRTWRAGEVQPAD